MHKGYLRTAFILGAITVALGAFGAHKLKEMVNAEALAVYQTGILYQFIHLVALAIAGIVYREYPNGLVKASGLLFLAGIILFSGSLYILTYATASGSAGLNWVGPVTPIGGVCFIAGWICLALGTGKRNSHADQDR